MWTERIKRAHQADVTHAQAVLKNRMSFIGNIDASGILALGTVGDVARETDKILTDFSDTNRSILNARCEIPPGAPAERIRAMDRIARA